MLALGSPTISLERNYTKLKTQQKINRNHFKDCECTEQLHTVP